MKKISLVLAMLLAFAVVFTACSTGGGDDGDPALTAADLEDTSWMLGTWKMETSVDIDIKDYPESMKKQLEEYYKSRGSYTQTVTITEANVKGYKEILEGEIEDAKAGEETKTTSNGKTTTSSSVTINADKTVITIVEKTVNEGTNGGYSGKVTLYETTTLTKQ